MKFSARTPKERTAIDAWIRLTASVREKACMLVADDFVQSREESISQAPIDLEKMLHHYALYQTGHYRVSFTQYFQVSYPEECGAILLSERPLKA